MERPNWLISETADVYHCKSREFLSSHQLGDFRKCPQLYWKKQQGLIQEEERPAYAFGGAAHTLILEGKDVFNAQYAIGGPINPKTGKPFGSGTKVFAEWAEAQGKPVVTEEDWITLELMQNAVRMHPVASSLIADGVAEGVCRVNFLTELGSIPCQIRLDYFKPKEGIIDLKTCDDLTWFESDARRYGYLYNMAFYRSISLHATGNKYPVHFIAVEKKEPFRVGVWRLAESALDFAETENRDAMNRLLICRETQAWPTGYEDIRIFDAA